MGRRIVKWIISAWVLWFLLHTAVTLIVGLRDNLAKADLIVVFGNKVEPGSKPSDRLKSRLDKAAEVYYQKLAPKILVSGGIDPSDQSEARVMAEYLVTRKVPVDDILLDEKGNNTRLTVKHSIAIMKKHDMKRVIVVSQFYHILRIRLCFASHGVKSVYSAHAGIWELRDVYSTLREYFAYYYYLATL